MDMATRVPNLDKAACISYTVKILGKDMNPNILPTAMIKQ